MITATGAVCALGTGVGDVVTAALEGACGVRDCTSLLLAEGFGSAPIRHAAVVEESPSVPLAADCSRSTRYALSAAGEALRASELLGDGEGGLRPTGVDAARIGVIAGTAAPAADMYFAVSRRALTEGLATVSGRTAPNLSAHAPAAALALRYGLQGPNFTISAACATGALVVLAAVDQIRAGRADVMVAVAAESAVSAVGLASFAQAHALGQECRPFDRARDGLIFGEGAAAFIVESAEHAKARGVHTLAAVHGGALTDDAHQMWAPEVGSWARTMSLALHDADMCAADVAYVSAHAAGTRIGDAAEVAALHKALGPRADEIPVWSTKGMHGHAFGASGALEILIAIHALRAGRVPQTVGLVDSDGDCDLDHVPDAGRAGRPGVVLKDSFGIGGTNCVLVLDVHHAAPNR